MIRIVGLLWVLGCIGCATPPGVADDELQGLRPVAHRSTDREHQSGNLWYRLAINGTSLDVRVRLLQPPATTRFFLPTQWGGRSDFAQRIRISSASGPGGPRFLTIDRNEGRVEIEAADADWVELAYAVDLDQPPSTLHAGMSGGVLSLYGPAFLVLPAQQILDRSRDIRIEFHAPVSWNVIATWPLMSQSLSDRDQTTYVRGYVAPDGQGLRDAFLAAGNNLTVSSGLPDVQVGFGSNFAGDREGLVTAVDDAVSRYRTAFGHLGKVHVLVTTSANADEGNLGGLGRRGGFVLELPHQSVVDGPTTLLVWHEALHLWNGHQVVPRADSEAQTRWFKEGITHFLALQAACSDGAITGEFLFEELARVVDAYQRNPARATGKGSDLDTARLPYDFGALLGIAFDMDEPGLSSRWLQHVLSSRSADGFYDLSTLGVAFRASAATREATASWTAYVTQGAPIDPVALLRRAGLHFFRGSDSNPRVAAIEGNPRFRNLFGMCTNAK